MISSLLFGETVTVKNKHEDWLEIVCDFDSYPGWIPENYLEDMSSEYSNWKHVLRSQSAVLMHDSHRIHLTAGSNIPDSDIVKIREESWRLTIRDPELYLELWQHASGFMHVPYLWGGRSDCGMDCSGLVQVGFKMMGKRMPRDSSKQAELGVTVPFGEHLPNDLAFFHNKTGEITHVGIVARHGFIHASGRVRIDDLTARGIICRDNGTLTHHLAVIKRIMPQV
ncbi:MAG: C40 family peptidase [Bacteroidetes bacterium]|nr:C40 family peptidase [Bacteroidota bacterium]